MISKKFQYKVYTNASGLGNQITKKPMRIEKYSAGGNRYVLKTSYQSPLPLLLPGSASHGTCDHDREKWKPKPVSLTSLAMQCEWKKCTSAERCPCNRLATRQEKTRKIRGGKRLRNRPAAERERNKRWYGDESYAGESRLSGLKVGGTGPRHFNVVRGSVKHFAWERGSFMTWRPIADVFNAVFLQSLCGDSTIPS